MQAKAGSIFDNVMITDDLETARQFALDTWGKSKAAEKAMFDEWRVRRGGGACNGGCPREKQWLRCSGTYTHCLLWASAKRKAVFDRCSARAGSRQMQDVLEGRGHLQLFGGWWPLVHVPAV